MLLFLKNEIKFVYHSSVTGLKRKDTISYPQTSLPKMLVADITEIKADPFSGDRCK